MIENLARRSEQIVSEVRRKFSEQSAFEADRLRRITVPDVNEIVTIPNGVSPQKWIRDLGRG